MIDRYYDHDDAIFFLGRLVWQGEMSQSVPPLLDVAADPERDVYARIAAARAVMSCGSLSQQLTLWNTLLDGQAKIPRKLLAELLDGTTADDNAVSMLLKSIEKLPPYDRYDTSGLTRSLHKFIDRLPISSRTELGQPLADLVDGLGQFLVRTPHIERHACRVSEEFAWLLAPSTHAVERLVAERADAAVQGHALEILANSPAAREWRGEHFDGYKDTLSQMVPAWPELNDTLFWRRVSEERARLENDGKQLNRVLQVEWLDRYWSFEPTSFSRVIDWLTTRELEDDRLVALSLALRIYAEAKKPAGWLEELRAAVERDSVLNARLEQWLNPTLSDEERKWQQKRLEGKQRREEQRRQEEQERANLIAQIKADPDSVRNPPGLNPGEVSNGQVWLFKAITGNGVRTSRNEGADWRSLIDEFGNDVAVAYRKAAIAYWRQYKPGLPSEGADTSRISFALTFAMAGLEIEARETDKFPANLMQCELRRALRYATWEINGFPGWLETIYQKHPEAVLNAIETELFWELDNSNAGQPGSRLLHNLAFYAPWLHSALVEPLLNWVRENDLPNMDALRYSLQILGSGNADPADLRTLARVKAAVEQPPEYRAYWYAMWVDVEPESGIPSVENWLEGLGSNDGSHAAQLFVTALLGSRHGVASGAHFGNFLTASHLKCLYVLIHKHVRVQEDINRAGGQVYSPGLRDHAQDARGRLFNLLSEIPGKATYVALKDLIAMHPDPKSRPWMARRAYKRAEDDGDLEPWTAEKISQFASGLTATPTTHRQLFDLTVDRLIDLKNWLERGDSSPYLTWKRVETEPEMRNLFADRLAQNASNLVEVSQEPELANRQRIDIWMQNQTAGYPVPIELKLLDKGWTGPQLCKALKNQLVGGYLREGTERCGVMLLVWQGNKPTRRWRINGNLVDLRNLRNALKDYWNRISNSSLNVAVVEVVVIDLTQREIKAH